METLTAIYQYFMAWLVVHRKEGFGILQTIMRVLNWNRFILFYDVLRFNGVLAREKMMQPILTFEEVKYFFDKFKGGDVNDISYRTALIDTFISRVDVYDGDDARIEIYCHAKEQRINCPLDKLSRSSKEQLAPQVGLEPTTLRLTAACSTNWAIEENGTHLRKKGIPIH